MFRDSGYDVGVAAKANEYRYSNTPLRPLQNTCIATVQQLHLRYKIPALDTCIIVYPKDMISYTYMYYRRRCALSCKQRRITDIATVATDSRIMDHIM